MLKFCLTYQIILQLDFFGTQVNLSYKKDNQFRTPFGGSVTTICFFQIIILCYSNISDLLSKTKVQYTVSTQYNTQPSTLILGKDTQMIAISYDQSNFLSRPMVNTTMIQSSVHRYPDGTYYKKLCIKHTQTPLYFEPCTLDHFINLPSYNFNWTLAFQQQNISDYLCLQKNSTHQIGGVFVNQDFNYIKFSVTPCVNSTDVNPLNPWYPTCETPSKIKQNINQQSRMRLLFSNNILNPEKPTESITSFIDSQIYNLQIGSMYTTANIYINESILQTDESVFPIRSIHTERLLQFKQSEVQQQNAVGNFSVYGDFYILRSNYSTFSEKSYLKLTQVISYIGGFCQIFFLISAFLVNRYNTYVFYNELANKLYDFEFEPQNQNQKNQYSRQGKQYLDQELKQVINKDKSLWMNFKYFLNQLSCGLLFKTPEIKLLNQAFDQISQDLDIFTVLNNFKELDKLKKLLLNEDQQPLFNFFPKPIIKMVDDTAILSLKQIEQEEQEQRKNIEQLKKNNKKLKIQMKTFSVIAKAIIKLKKGRKTKISCYQKLFEYYQKLIKQPNQNNFQTSLNNKLIDCLGQEIKGIFEVANNIKNKKNSLQDNLQYQNQRKIQLVNSCLLDTQKNQNIDEINQKSQIQVELKNIQQNGQNAQVNLNVIAEQKDKDGLIIFTENYEDNQDPHDINPNFANEHFLSIIKTDLENI
ncbi:hypothetical protein ABPG72_017292 [Tetrahymena utriculariae]